MKGHKEHYKIKTLNYSIIKSLPENFSSTLYGKVFLLNPESLKLNSWFNIWFSAISGER